MDDKKPVYMDLINHGFSRGKGNAKAGCRGYPHSLHVHRMSESGIIPDLKAISTPVGGYRIP